MITTSNEGIKEMIVSKEVKNMGTFIIEGARKGLDYIREITMLGAPYARIGRFLNLSVEEQNRMISEVFLTELKQILSQSAKFSDYSISLKDGDIQIIYKVPVIVCGISMRGEKEKNTAYVDVPLVEIFNPALVGESSVQFEMRTADLKNVEPEVLISQVDNEKFINSYRTGSYSAKVETDEHKKLISLCDFQLWNEQLPTSWDIGERDNSILVNFIDVLRSHRYTDAVGEEVLNMKKIYHLANTVFPKYRGAHQRTKIRILDDAYTRAHFSMDNGKMNAFRNKLRAKPDIHVMARAVFEEIYLSNMHKEIILHGMRFELEKEYLREGYSHTTIREVTCALKYFRYCYKLGQREYIHECFKPFELWHSMVGSSDVMGIIA